MDHSAITVYAKGGFRAYGDAKVGLLTHGLQYGTGCFEGIRGYWDEQERELQLVLLRDHYERLALSAKILLMWRQTALTTSMFLRSEFPPRL